MVEVYRDPRFKSDEIFNYINKHFVTLKDEDMKENNKHLRRVIDKLMEIMKSEDKLFSSTFQRIAYAGSYYDGLKVGKPEEFDLDVVIDLPINYKNALTFHPDATHPGYIKIKIKQNEIKDLRQHPKWSNEYKSIDKWIDGNYHLYQDKFRCWIEGVVDKALNTLCKGDAGWVINLEGCKYTLSKKKSGPAMTIYIQVPAGYQIDVDLVPVLEFELPVPAGFRKTNKFKEKKWLAVAKPLVHRGTNILWRLSFYQQEREIIKGSLKPVIRHMKKMRDKLNLKSLASYYIKTLFLWELEKHKNNVEFEKLQGTCMFVYMLKTLRDAYKVGGNGIPDFWCEKQNLLNKLCDEEKENIYNRLARITQAIDKQIENNPFIVAEFILTAAELKKLKEDLTIKVRTATNGTYLFNPSTMLHRTQSLPSTVSYVETAGHSNNKTIGSLHLSKNVVAPVKKSISTQAVATTLSNIQTAGPSKNFPLGSFNSPKNGVAPVQNSISTRSVSSTTSNVNSAGPNTNAILGFFESIMKEVSTPNNDMSPQAVPVTSSNNHIPDPSRNFTFGRPHLSIDNIAPVQNNSSARAVPSNSSNDKNPGPNEATLFSLKKYFERMNIGTVLGTLSSVQTADVDGNGAHSSLNSLKNELARTKNIVNNLNAKVIMMENEAKRTNNLVNQLSRKVADMEIFIQEFRRENKLQSQLDSML